MTDRELKDWIEDQSKLNKLITINVVILAIGILTLALLKEPAILAFLR